jgi:DNA-binding transcriptional ArsR family regulator
VDIFFALADPTRRKILELLASRGQLSATEIYANFAVSHPAISQHLKVLREAKLVKMKKHAQLRIYQINPDAMLELEDWTKQLAQHWNQRDDALEELIKVENENSTGNKNRKDV